MIDFGTHWHGRDQMLIPFRAEHLQRADLKDDELRYMEKIPQWYEYVLDTAYEDLSWSLFRLGRAACMFGVRPLWPGVGEVWMIPTQHVDRSAIALVKGGRHIFNHIQNEYDVRRLQITVRSSNETAYKFAQKLYFKTEGLMEQFGPEGESYYMMARIKNGSSTDFTHVRRSSGSGGFR